MDPIEKAIRAALEKGNPEDSAFRQKIYASAQSALLRSLSARTDLDDATKKVRLQRLAHSVGLIESEFTPATAPLISAQTRTAPSTTAPPASPPQGNRSQEPRFENYKPMQRAPEVERAGHVQANDPDPLLKRSAAKPGKKPANPDEKPIASLFSKLVSLFVFVTILAILVMFGWMIWNSSLFGNGDDKGAGPARLQQSESSTDGSTQGIVPDGTEAENWITLFEPKDASAVQASKGLAAELRGNGPGAFLHIANEAKETQGEATFEIGRGVLESLRGKKIVFNIRARTTDGLSTQIATSCSLAGMGECKRVRFQLEGQVSENLMIVQLTDDAPEASGTLSILPDIDKTGNPVEITAIMVRAEP